MRKHCSRRSFLAVTAAGAALAACKGAPAPRHADAKPAPGHTRLPAGGAIARRPLGSTGEMVSMIGLGGYHLGVPKDEQEAIRIVRTAIDHGVNFLDNCWDYSGGESERRMGKALKDGYRHRAFLMTKLDGRTKEAAAAQLDQSLSRLGTDVIDLVQIHEVIRMSDPARVFGPDGAIEALVAARQAGKIRYIGFTGHKDPSIHLAMLRAALDNDFAFDTVQMPVNVMDAHYRSFGREVLPLLDMHGIGVLGMKSIGGGVLLSSGAVSARECLRYSLSQPTSVVITGCDSMGVLEQALDVAMRFSPLRADEERDLLARTAPFAKNGRFELFKTTTVFDGTAQNPKWLEGAEI